MKEKNMLTTEDLDTLKRTIWRQWRVNNTLARAESGAAANIAEGKALAYEAVLEMLRMLGVNPNLTD